MPQLSCGTRLVTADRKFANTLGRGLSILRVFRAGDDGLTHAAIAERTGLPKPTVSRLTYTLCALGYLTQHHRNGKFRLGPAAIAMGAVANMSMPYLKLVDQDLQELADATGCLALVAMPVEDKMMIIKTWRPDQGTAIWLEPGHRLPVFGSSSGQAVLASMSAATFDALAPDENLRAYRQDGYDQLLANGFTAAPEAVRFSETVSTVSVPYYSDPLAGPVGFSCGNTPDRLSTERINAEIGPMLRDIVKSLESRTGQLPALTRRD